MSINQYIEAIQSQNNIKNIVPNPNLGSIGVHALMETAIQNKKYGFKSPTWRTGSDFFNTSFNGIDRVCVIGAGPGTGKTTWARNLALEYLQNSPYNKVLYLDSETDRNTAYRKLLSALVGFNINLWSTKIEVDGYDVQNQFPIYFARRVDEALRSKNPKIKALYSEFQSIAANRFEIVCKDHRLSDNSTVFSSDKAFTEAILSALVRDGNKTDRLLVVVDHLGEFDMGSPNEAVYRQANKVLSVIDAFLRRGDDGLVTTLDQLIMHDPSYQTIFDSVKQAMHSFAIANPGTLQGWEKTENYSLPKIDFLILSQLTKDSLISSGRNGIMPQNWSLSNLASSKKLGEMAEQVMLLWNAPSNACNYIPKYSSEEVRRFKLYGSYKPIFGKLAKARYSENRGTVFPLLMNGSSGQVVMPNIGTSINEHNYLNWLERMSLGRESVTTVSEKVSIIEDRAKEVSEIDFSIYQEEKKFKNRFHPIFDINNINIIQ